LSKKRGRYEICVVSCLLRDAALDGKLWFSACCTCDDLDTVTWLGYRAIACVEFDGNVSGSGSRDDTGETLIVAFTDTDSSAYKGIARTAYSTATASTLDTLIIKLVFVNNALFAEAHVGVG